MNTSPTPRPATPDAAGPAAASEHSFVTWDGTRLFFRAWAPTGPGTRAVLLFHRGHEHSGRMAELAEDLRDARTWVFAWDQRGHGRSPGRRGDAPSIQALVKDVDAFTRHLAATFGVPVEEMAVVAYSLASVIVSAWVHDHAPRIKAMVLGAPAFRVKLYVPLALPALRVLTRAIPGAFVRSYVTSSMLTRDPIQARRYDEDPLIEPGVAAHLLVDLADTAARVVEDAGAIRVPTLVLSPDADLVVEAAPQRRFVERLGSEVKEQRVLAGFRHALFHEKDRARAVIATRNFLARAFEGPGPGERDLLEADRREADAEEVARLRRPLPPWDPRRWGYAGLRAALGTVGCLSEGVRVGWRAGFDSGESLDYVYEDTARGVTPVGTLIDRVYLDTPGWRGIRERRRNLEALLEEALEDRCAANGSAAVVDVAAGPGRYLLETLWRRPDLRVTALLRDADPGGLEVGRRLAAARGLTQVRYELGDAFDPAELAALDPRPDVAVVSGLYELFPDNGGVRASLRGLFEGLAPGGVLLYTNQPWHPQAEEIARVLTNRDGEPWVMRMRSQAEMDALVRAAGFEKLRTAADAQGIFTVSIARKAAR